MLLHRKPPAIGLKTAVKTVLALLIFVLGLVLAYQGWTSLIKSGNTANTLGISRGTLTVIRRDVEALGEDYKKKIIEDKYSISVGRLSLKSLPDADQMDRAPWQLGIGLALMLLCLFIPYVSKYVLIYSVLMFAVFPFFWMVLASFKNNVDVIDSSNGILNFAPTLKNYVTVFSRYNFLKPTFNSFFVAIASTGIGLIIGLPAAYAVSRYKLYKISLIILVVRMIPGITFLVPWYLLFLQIGLTNTFAALIMSHLLVALPFIIWIMVPFFDNAPKELEEAAWVDGCAKWRTFLRIVLPVSVPGILTASLLAFIFSWNNFMFSLTLSGAKTTTLPIAIYGFVGYAAVDWGGLMAAAVFITLPIILLSLSMQKYIISGLTAGAVKG